MNVQQQKIAVPRPKVRSSAAHMPTRAMRDRSKYSRKGKSAFRYS